MLVARQSNLRRVVVAAAAAVACVLLLPATAAAAVAHPPAIGDACLVGRWVDQKETAPGNWTWAGTVIPSTGLSGLVITYSAAGEETDDWNHAQPLISSYQGKVLKAVITGVLTFRVHADGHRIYQSSGGGNLGIKFYLDGVFQPGGYASAVATTVTYICGATRLHLETPAINAGYGPQIDDLIRVNPLAGSQSLASTVASSLPTPGDLLKAPVALLVNALITLALVLLVTFPSHLFNRTYEENHDAIRNWWERRMPQLVKLRTRIRRFRERNREELSYAAVVLAGGVLASLLDPRSGLNLRTLALFIGAVLALTVGTLVAALAAAAYRISRNRGGGWRLHALPSGLVVAALCVLISRIVSFQPGYLYGLIGGITFARALSGREEGHVVAVTSIVTLLVSVAAWLLWVPVSIAATANPTTFGWALLANFLAAIFVSGTVGLLIGLVPLRFLPGEKLARWHRGAWGAVFGVAGLALFEVMLRPQSAGAHVASVPFWTTVGLFVAFGTASLLFWGYFRVRKPMPSPELIETSH